MTVIGGAWAAFEHPPLHWSSVGSFDYWPKFSSWTSPLPISNRQRLRTVAKVFGDPARLRRLKRYWKRMAREKKMK